jgi:hypothetical protein
MAQYGPNKAPLMAGGRGNAVRGMQTSIVLRSGILDPVSPGIDSNYRLLY